MKKAAVIHQESGRKLTDAMYLLILESIKYKHFKKLEVMVSLLHSADCATLVERLEPTDREFLVHTIQIEELGNVLAHLNHVIRAQVINMFSKADVAQALYELETNRIAEILSVVEEERRNDILNIINRLTPGEERQVQQTKSILSYPENSAARLMKYEILTAPKSWTIGRLKKFLNESEDLPERILCVFIVNRQHELIGSLSLNKILRASDGTVIKDIMRTESIKVSLDTHHKEVQRLFEKYNLNTCAVVNSDNKLVGEIPIYNILELSVQQRDKDMMHMAGLDNKSEDLFIPVRETTSKRVPWLVINLITAILASAVIAIFQDQIQKVVALAVLMPIIASMGTNAGTQTVVVVIRGLATDQITPNNALRLLRKELTVGSFNGLMLGLVISLATSIFYSDSNLALVVFLSTIIIHLISALAGHLIPILLNKFNKDPAVSSGILLTTVTDVVGFFTFLGLASLIL